MKLKIFIDTSEFISANFSFSGNRLGTIITRAKSGQIELGMPSITKREVLSNIEKSLSTAEQSILKARNGAKILKNLDSELTNSLFSELNVTNYFESMTSQLEVYLKESSAVELNMDGVDPKEVFELYFSKKPPFGDGKKRSEFPDAFALQMLSYWGEEDSSKVLIASSDKDIEEGAKNYKNLEYVGSLNKLLSRIARDFDKLFPLALQASESIIEGIKWDIERKFLDLGFYIDDQEGEVVEIKVHDVSLDLSLLSVDLVDEVYGSGYFTFFATVAYEADLTYDDMDTAIYDSEEKRHYVVNTINESVDRDEIIEGDIHISFPLPGTEDNTDFDLAFFRVSDISVSSSYADDWN